MKPLHLEQSLPICCSLAALGGILEVAATAVTAVPAVREKEGIQMKWWSQWLAIAGNVAIQAVGSLISHLIATWFGPVSIVVPFFYSATLLSNMLIFGLLGEHFTKNMRVGTHVIVVAVILLPVVGPKIQEDQDITSLMRHWYSILWFIILLVACAIAGVLLMLDITKYGMKTRTVILCIARAASICVNLTVSRSFILGPSQSVLIAFIVIKILSGGIYTYAIVVQSFAVEQARFVPLNATTIIIVNAITGVIIWEDWRVVTSWYGYVCVFVLLGLGCDLLLSVPLLNNENPELGVNKQATLIIQGSQTLKRLSIDTRFYDDIPDADDSETCPSSNERSSLSRKEAWKEIVSPIHSIQNRLPESSDDDNKMQSTKNKDWKRSLRPGDLDGGALETNALISKQPKNIGHHISNGAKEIGEKGRRLVNTIAAAADPENLQPLSRIAAWKETISPLKSMPKWRVTDDGDQDT